MTRRKWADVWDTFALPVLFVAACTFASVAFFWAAHR